MTGATAGSAANGVRASVTAMRGTGRATGGSGERTLASRPVRGMRGRSRGARFGLSGGRDCGANIKARLTTMPRSAASTSDDASCSGATRGLSAGASAGRWRCMVAPSAKMASARHSRKQSTQPDRRWAVMSVRLNTPMRAQGLSAIRAPEGHGIRAVVNRSNTADSLGNLAGCSSSSTGSKDSRLAHGTRVPELSFQLPASSHQLPARATSFSLILAGGWPPEAGRFISTPCAGSERSCRVQ